MSLRKQLQEDLQAAMRARDVHRKSALRMVLTSVQLAEVESPRPLDDAAVLDLIRKEVKRREEALEIMRDAGRDDLVTEEAVELELLRVYLPAQMSEADVRELARDAIQEVGADSPRDMGKVMGVLMPRLQGRADGRMVNQIVRDLLSA
jgi:uncharacterized protein